MGIRRSIASGRVPTGARSARDAWSIWWSSGRISGGTVHRDEGLHSIMVGDEWARECSTPNQVATDWPTVASASGRPHGGRGSPRNKVRNTVKAAASAPGRRLAPQPCRASSWSHSPASSPSAAPREARPGHRQNRTGSLVCRRTARPGRPHRRRQRRPDGRARHWVRRPCAYCGGEILQAAASTAPTRTPRPPGRHAGGRAEETEAQPASRLS